MPSLTIKGNAKHPNLEPVKNATVEILEPNETLILTMTTNDKGDFKGTTKKWSGNVFQILTFSLKQAGKTQKGPIVTPALDLPILVYWNPPGSNGAGDGGVFDGTLPIPSPSLPTDTSFFMAMIAQLFPGGVLDFNSRNTPNFPEKFGDITATVEWIGLQHTIPVVPIILGRSNEVSIDVSEWINDNNGCCSDEGVEATVDWIGTQHTVPIIPIVIGEGNQITIKAPHRLDTHRDIASTNNPKVHE